MTSGNKKLIFFDFVTLYYGGGCEINFMNLGKWLSKKSYDVSYITGAHSVNNIVTALLRQGEYKENFSDNKIKEEFEVKNYSRFTLADMFLPTRNRRNILSQLKNADVIYSKNEIFEVLLLKYVFHVDLKKVVFGFHTPIYYPTVKSWQARLHNILYSSDFFFNLLGEARVRCLVLSEKDTEILKGKKLRSVITIPNPLNTEKFYRKTFSKRGYFQITYIGRMTEQKGIDVLAEAIRKLSLTPHFREMRFSFVGSGIDEGILKKIAEEYENCSFIGFSTDTLGFYQDADLIVVPSRAETFCYVVAEAQSCAIPVIASDIPGPRNLVLQGKSGWLVPSEDATVLADSIQTAFALWNSDPDAYINMGICGRENMIEKFSHEQINLRLEDFIFNDSQGYE